MTPTLLDRHDPRRNDALGLVRRMVKADNFTKGDVARWKRELGDDVIERILDERAPKKKTKKDTKADQAPPEKE